MGVFYGDGSGCAQNSIGDRQATWALTIGGRTSDSSAVVPAAFHKRGAVQGWHPTVPRSEVTAVIRFLDLAGAGSEYVGDCKYALDVIQAGVPPRFRASGCADADLWRVAARALQQKGGASNFTFTKTKAHRSYAQAEVDGELSLTHWAGNSRADALAKSLARRVLCERTSNNDQDVSSFPGGFGALLEETAMGAAWAIQHWPEVGKRAKSLRTGGRKGLATPGTEVGPHSLVPHDGGGWHCVDCLLVTRTNASRRSLRITPCRGSVTAQCHATHELRWSHGVYWCWRCGRYTIKRPRALRHPCPGAPASAAACNVLRRLREGRPPTTASYLYDVAQAATRPPSVATENAHASRGGPGPRLDEEEEVAPVAPLAATLGADADDLGSSGALSEHLSQAVSEASGAGAGPDHVSRVSPQSCRRRLHGKQPTAPCSHHVPSVASSSHGAVQAVDDSGTTFGAHQDPGRGPEELSEFNDDRFLHHVHHHRLPVAVLESSPSGGLQAEVCHAFEIDHHPHHVGHHHHRPRAPPVEQGMTATSQALVDRRSEHPGTEEARHPVHSVRAVPAICRPGGNAPWTSRVVVSALSVAAECTLCHVPSRVSCRGCGRQLCLRCARERKWCTSAPRTDAPAVAVAAGAVLSVLPSSRVPAAASALADGIGGRGEDTTN